ncbi:NADH dehydrogenase [ubiquinone] 1 alpha subcomplex subunit 2 [Zea mays]|uniref:NADH dehydrogenase [ubiquinone] 1 alpha subcomplex subunit 2 n=2 Tax=Zea mays TaxID=4577 RepID=A0A3L6EB66_MAIZE|nr:NADH dehydrogenase [ubiquinone] 1 alpha subcomplex subunit 2 [Zea mays]
MAWRASLSRSLKEIRVLFCQSSPASAAAREFVKKNYGDIKARNPSLPFLVRECSGVQPQLWARYGTRPSISSVSCYMGVERCVNLDGLTEAQIDKKLEELAKAGESLKTK